MSLMNYKHLRYFQAVAHDGNLTRAAQALNLSQSALSTQIRTLEDRLGHNLFDRIGRQLVLTEAGRIALDYADAIFKTGDEMIAVLAQSDTGRRAVRVGALATLSRNFQLDFLRPLIARSDVEVILRSGSQGELLSDLQALRLDIVLTNTPPPRDRAAPWLAQKISEQPVSLIATPELCAGRDDLTTLLTHEALVLPTLETGLRAGFDLWAARLGLRPQIAAEVDDIAMMRLLAREGAGIAVLPPIAVRDELASGLLIEVAQIDGLVESFHAITLSRRFPNPLVDELLQAQG
ncbi:LysR family transcriptional regulator [Roseinatronobacter monicus]|uniref:LysR family transcriptional regulator n=1 Tax=Roseinatronobacter monicus TaxID=393481 RepID=UPI003F373D3A